MIGRLDGMDCADMVIAQVIGNQYRILDYYSRDRSTPQPDSFYDGTESLTAAVGTELNGVTKIVFRKKLTGKLDVKLTLLKLTQTINE